MTNSRREVPKATVPVGCVLVLKMVTGEVHRRARVLVRVCAVSLAEPGERRGRSDRRSACMPARPPVMQSTEVRDNCEITRFSGMRVSRPTFRKPLSYGVVATNLVLERLATAPINR